MAQAPDEPPVLAEVADGVMTVTLNRPGRGNGWNGEVARAYFGLLEDAARSPEVRAIVLTGAGKSFCIGGDGQKLDEATSSGNVKSTAQRAYWFPLQVGKPIIGAINGACFGIGLQQALCCDIRIAADDAKFSTAYARRGLVAEMGMSWLLPRIVGDLTRSYPGLDIHVRETLTPTLLRELEQGRIDTAIVALPVGEPAFTEVPLFTENFVLVRPRGDDAKPVPDKDSLREMRLLLLEEGHCFRDQALSFCNMQTGLPREGLDASSLSTLVQMVDAGIGVTFIPEMALPVETRSATVSVARFPDPQPARTVGMIWRKTSPLADQLSRIAETVRASAEAVRNPAAAPDF